MPPDSTEFGVKDMLLLLNSKMDDVLREVATKASTVEVNRLRDRMHEVEADRAVVKSLVDLMKEVRDDQREISERLDDVETNQVSKQAVDAALARNKQESRTLLFQVAGILGTIGGVNIIVNIMQAPK